MNTESRVPDKWIQQMKTGLLDRILLDMNDMNRDPTTYKKKDTYFVPVPLTDAMISRWLETPNIAATLLKEVTMYEDLKTIRANVSTEIPAAYGEQIIPKLVEMGDTYQTFGNKGEREDVIRAIQDLPQNQQDMLMNMHNSLAQLHLNESSPFVQNMYSNSMKTLLKLGPLLLQVGEGVAKASTPLVIAIESVLATISLLLLGQEAVRKSWDKRNVSLYRRFYERMHILVQKLPTISPIDTLETRGTKADTETVTEGEPNKIRSRLRSLLNLTSNQSTVESVENFFAQFQLVDGESISRQPLYNDFKPKKKESVRLQQGEDVDPEVEVEYLMFPIKVEEFLRGSKVGWNAVPTVTNRKTDSAFADIETSLYESIAVARKISDIVSKKSEKNPTGSSNENTATAMATTTTTPVTDDKNKLNPLQKFLNLINPKMDEMNKMENNYKITLKEKGVQDAKPNTIWDALYHLFEEEPNKYYLATYFLWAARIILQNYIKWANYELGKIKENTGENSNMNSTNVGNSGNSNKNKLDASSQMINNNSFNQLNRGFGSQLNSLDQRKNPGQDQGKGKGNGQGQDQGPNSDQDQVQDQSQRTQNGQDTNSLKQDEGIIAMLASMMEKKPELFTQTDSTTIPSEIVAALVAEHINSNSNSNNNNSFIGETFI